MRKAIAVEERIDDDLMLVTEHMLWMAVCAPNVLTADEVENRVRLKFRESGTIGGWQLARQREDMRVNCDDEEERSHWLFLS